MSVYVCDYVYAYISTEGHLIFIAHEFCTCKFIYLLKFVCNTQINTCSAFVVTCEHAQSGEKFESLYIHVPDVKQSGVLPCFSSHSLSKHLFHSI